MLTKTAFFVTILATISLTSATVVQKCPEGAGEEPIFAGIANCDVKPCQVKDNLEMLITFRATNNSYTLVPKVLLTIGPLTINYPVYPMDGCKSIVNGNCPIPQGELVVYHLVMPVDSFPKVTSNLEFSLRGDDDVVFQCFKVDIQPV